MENEMDEIKKTVEMNGDVVMMKEHICLLYKSEHNNCAGCPCELGCIKMCSIGIIEMSSIVLVEQGKAVDYELLEIAIQLVLDSKSVADIHKITNEVAGY